MNRKRIIIIIAIIVIAIAPIVVVGANKFQRKNDGRTVVEVGQDISDIEDGEKLVLVAPANGKTGEEDDLERKKAYEANMYSEDNIAQPTIEEYSAEDEQERLQYEKEKKEKEAKEQEVLNVLYKYYDKEVVNEIVKAGMNNRYASDNSNYSKEVERLIEITVQVLEKENLDQEDEKTLRYFLDVIHLDIIENEELKTRIKNLGIEI